MTTPAVIEGQLNATERKLLSEGITLAKKKPGVVIEVGTWLGGGSTLHILRALEQNGTGHLWGVEADRSIYDRMLANIRAAAPEASGRFTPVFGFSQNIIPQWLAERGKDVKVDFAFLDGGNNPGEQIDEFHLLDPFIPVGGQLMAHDAKLRKAKWLVPYIMKLDHWQAKVNDVSDEGFVDRRESGGTAIPGKREGGGGVPEKDALEFHGSSWRDPAGEGDRVSHRDHAAKNFQADHRGKKLTRAKSENVQPFQILRAACHG